MKRKKRIGFVMGISLLAVLGGCRESPSDRIARAKDAVFAQNPKEALEQYRLALESLDHNDSAEAQIFRARALRGAADIYYLELRDFKRAVEVYRELIRSCPDAPESLEGRIHLADLLRTQFHDLRGAIAELTAAIERNAPQSAEIRYQVAKLYFELQDYQQVQLECRDLVKRYETSAFVDDARFLEAQALAMEQRPAEAMKAFTSLAEQHSDSPFRPHALYELGKLHEEAGAPAKAIEVWVAALGSHPDPRMVQDSIARVRQRIINTTPEELGRQKAFEHPNPSAAARAPRKIPSPAVVAPSNANSSVEAAGGTAEEAAKEQASKRLGE